ncbi:uncharacterized protein [Dipodomys merriami]|uniref:uncharacterized protein n=1 Tax=Dipodomys merriami TaxID=94247 RepID=UPI003855A136
MAAGRSSHGSLPEGSHSRPTPDPSVRLSRPRGRRARRPRLRTAPSTTSARLAEHRVPQPEDTPPTPPHPTRRTRPMPIHHAPKADATPHPREEAAPCPYTTPPRPTPRPIHAKKSPHAHTPRPQGRRHAPVPQEGLVPCPDATPQYPGATPSGRTDTPRSHAPCPPDRQVPAPRARPTPSPPRGHFPRLQGRLVGRVGPVGPPRAELAFSRSPPPAPRPGTLVPSSRLRPGWPGTAPPRQRRVPGPGSVRPGASAGPGPAPAGLPAAGRPCPQLGRWVLASQGQL